MEPLPLTDARATLRADCSRCDGLCCVAPAFSRSADFALDKPAGVPCPQLAPDARCRIHASLRERGFPGCTVFDCFGAGQHVVQVTLPGTDWRESAGSAATVFGVFGVVRQLKELLWYLAEARALLPPGPLLDRVLAEQGRTEALADAHPADLEQLDTSAFRAQVGPLLGEVSAALRADVPGRREQAGADLVGARLQGADLRGTGLRGAYLLGADLRDADLTRADLLGADLRGADVRGAQLAGSLFLTRPQVAAARGDARTTLPEWCERPAHWA